MKIRIVSFVTVKSIEERAAKKWVKGTGKDAEFIEESEGFYAMFREWPGSAFLGPDNPGVQPGDKLKLSLEKVS